MSHVVVVTIVSGGKTKIVVVVVVAKVGFVNRLSAWAYSYETYLLLVAASLSSCYLGLL